MRLTIAEHGAQIEEWLKEGRSYREISRELGCAKDTVSIFAARNFPSMKRQAPPPTPPVVLKPTSGGALKLLVLDIETRPTLAYVWRVWKENISPRQIVEDNEVISFAAKWLDEDETMFYSTFHHGKEAMVKAAWDLLDECDGVIHYNGTRFDIPHLNSMFVKSELPPPSTFRNVDLLTTVKREFNFSHNKRDHVADKLGLGRKVEHEGFELWTKCMAGDEDAWNRMAEYNVNDVLLTERLYHRVLPYIKSHPSYAAAMRDAVCPNCGSGDLRNKGYQYTTTGSYKRYICQGCGKSCRDRKANPTTSVTPTASG
jgi:hypothetical protein